MRSAYAERVGMNAVTGQNGGNRSPGRSPWFQRVGHTLAARGAKTG